MSERIDWEALREAAAAARERAHAPYSGYRVGAALLAEDGRIFVGANVENASYGLSLCAERSAVGAAVTAGARHFLAMTIVTEGDRPGSPCGMCRQTLAEFPPSFPIRCHGVEGGLLESDVESLLPHGFGPDHLKK